jgi:hypothetical protein
MKKLFFLVGLIILSIQVISQNALTYLEIKVTSGNVGAHFSRYNGPYSIGVSYKGIKMNIPTGKSNYTKLFNRDDDTRRIYAGENWVLSNKDLGGNGIFILDLADWDGATAYVKLVINGQLMFEGQGSCGNFDCWTDKKYGDKVRKTDDREIAIDLF